MARRRLQKSGHVYKDGNFWFCRWREDVKDAAGKIRRLRRKAIICDGKKTKREAQRMAWDNVLSKLDQFTAVPQSIITLSAFWAQKFEPEFVWSLKTAGKEHYKYCWSRIMPELGDKPLRDITASIIQAFCRKMLEERKLSTQTVTHLKFALSSMFKHAKAHGYYVGENPASLVRLPEIVSKPVNALNFEQATAALELLKSPVREMAFLSMTTSANVAELCGLRWFRVNLTEQPIMASGDFLPTASMAIRENWYRNKPGTVKTGKRNRIVPLPAEAVTMLKVLAAGSEFTGPDDYVFASSSGKPVDAHNVNNRVFKKLGECEEDEKDVRKLLLKRVKITWHVFRHSCATFAEAAGMERSDRISLMGHGTGAMTDRYTHRDIERLRASVEVIARRLLPKDSLGEMEAKGGIH